MGGESTALKANVPASLFYLLLGELSQPSQGLGSAAQLARGRERIAGPLQFQKWEEGPCHPWDSRNGDRSQIGRRCGRWTAPQVSDT